MNQGYYKIINVTYTAGNGEVINTQNIQYYDTDYELLTVEHYEGYIRPEYNIPLPENI
jgi:hypothetical protein